MISVLVQMNEDKELSNNMENNDCEENIVDLIAMKRIFEGKFLTDIEEIENYDTLLTIDEFTEQEKVDFQKEIDESISKCQEKYNSINLNCFSPDSMEVNFIGIEDIEEDKKFQYRKNWLIIIKNNCDYEIKHRHIKMKLLDKYQKVIFTEKDFDKLLDN